LPLFLSLSLSLLSPSLSLSSPLSLLSPPLSSHPLTLSLLSPLSPLPPSLSLSLSSPSYVFTLPCAYARSILTVPWVELGGKVTISCAKSGYSATVTFHTKPFYGGKIHRWV
uniref:Uncharacterized protein n=1 Tax=Oncorhynchus kisutch TaxID=8019 RepID=A0A8C7KBS9_ONCKI